MSLHWREKQPSLNAVTAAGEQIVLRPWQLGDVDSVFQACQDVDIQQWTRVPVPYLRQHAEYFVRSSEWQNGARVGFAVVDPVDNCLLGSCGLVGIDEPGCVVEVGYWVARWARRRGIATAATRSVTEWAIHSLGARRVVLEAAVGNIASQQVARAAGFVREGIQRSETSRFGESLDMVLFSVVPSDCA
jgi:RimJ/RimL family protein N-acetyltransferase